MLSLEHLLNYISVGLVLALSVASLWSSFLPLHLHVLV